MKLIVEPFQRAQDKFCDGAPSDEGVRIFFGGCFFSSLLFLVLINRYSFLKHFHVFAPHFHSLSHASLSCPFYDYLISYPLYDYYSVAIAVLLSSPFYPFFVSALVLPSIMYAYPWSCLQSLNGSRHRGDDGLLLHARDGVSQWEVRRCHSGKYPSLLPTTKSGELIGM